MNGDLADLREPLYGSAESFRRLRIIAGVVPNGLLGVLPRVAFPSMSHEGIRDAIDVFPLDHTFAREALHLHTFLLHPPRLMLPDLHRLSAQPAISQVGRQRRLQQDEFRGRTP